MQELDRNPLQQEVLFRPVNAFAIRAGFDWLLGRGIVSPDELADVLLQKRVGCHAGSDTSLAT